MKFSIFGAGAWGTAMAISLTRENHSVRLIPRRKEHALEIASARENRAYLPGHLLDPRIAVDWRMEPALEEADAIFLACPSKGLRDLSEQIRDCHGRESADRLFIALCKGMEEGTDCLPTEIIEAVLPGNRFGALSGPSYAGEVAAGKPTAIVFACSSGADLTASLQRALSSRSLRVYTTRDLRGLELGACLKNVYAIAAGICDGLGLGDNAKAALITRSLAEMVRLGVSLGGELSTFYGLSGFGDLIATCGGKWSRNRTFGQLIAQGESVESLLEVRKMTVEGYQTTQSYYHLTKERGLEAPILEEMHAVLFSGKLPRDVIESLMGRVLKSERA